MNTKSSIVTSAADGCGKPSSIRSMDKSDRSIMEQKESFMFSNRSSFSRGCSLAAVAAVAVIAMGLHAPVAHASLLVYEPFNYTAGSTLDNQGNSSDVGFQTGSTWQYGGGTQDINTIVSPLTYTDSNGNTLAGSGNAVSLPNTNGNAEETEYRNLSTIYGASGQTWISLLGQGSTEGSNWAGLSLFNISIIPTTEDQEVMMVGEWSNDWSIVDYPTPGNGVGVASTSSAANEAFLVYQIELGTSTGYTINMWVNPLLGSSLSTTPNATYTNTTDTFPGFDQLVLHSGTQATFGQIRIGTSYADVAPIPEPATLGLVAVGGLGLLLISRKRSTQ